MNDKAVDACVAVSISDDDVFEAMKDIAGYVDITPGDFKELYVKAYQHAVRRLVRSVTASDVMTKDVASVKASTPLKDVAQLMASRRISRLPVIDDNAKVVGVISEKDFLSSMSGREARNFMEVIAQCLGGRACLAAPSKAQVAADLMSSPAVTVSLETPVMDVAEILTERKINRVPVTDSDGTLRGIVSRADVVRSSLLLEAQ